MKPCVYVNNYKHGYNAKLNAASATINKQKTYVPYRII